MRYSRAFNKTPAKFSHNTLVEVIWTVVPVLILVVIAVPSFRLLYFTDNVDARPAELTVKAVGQQWNWRYVYADPNNDGNGEDGFEILSNMQREANVSDPRLYKLETDYPLVLPVGKTVHVQVTGADVIHSWAVPGFGLKLDAIPGHVNQLWIDTPEEPSIFYGQCAEICGKDHAFMPIEVRVVSQSVYDAYTAAMLDDPDAANAMVIAYFDDLRTTRMAQASTITAGVQ